MILELRLRLNYSTLAAVLATAVAVAAAQTDTSTADGSADAPHERVSAADTPPADSADAPSAETQSSAVPPPPVGPAVELSLEAPVTQTPATPSPAGPPPLLFDPFAPSTTNGVAELDQHQRHVGPAYVGVWKTERLDPRAEYYENKMQRTGLGVTLGLDDLLDTGISPYVRYGRAEDDSAAIAETIAQGVAIKNPFGHSGGLLGVGTAVGRPMDASLREQQSFEAFYRIQLKDGISLTPNAALIMNPAEAPDEEKVGVVGLRLLFDF